MFFSILGEFSRAGSRPKTKQNPKAKNIFICLVWWDFGEAAGQKEKQEIYLVAFLWDFDEQTTDLEMAITQSQLTTQSRRQPVSSLSLCDVLFLISDVSLPSGYNSTPFIPSPKSGSLSGIPVPSNTFQKVQPCTLEITWSHKFLSLLSARWCIAQTLPPLHHIINMYVTSIAITSWHC